MREIYIFRHGQTDYNLNRKIQGQGIDSSINETGRMQASAFFDTYQSVDFEIGYYSKLQRTKETISPFIDAGLPTESYAELNEISWGDWEGQGYSPGIKSVYKEMIDAWSSGNPDYKLPGAESATELIQRLSRFWEGVKNSDYRKILICSHGRAIRGLLTVIFEEPPKEMEKYGHSNTGLFKIAWTNTYRELVLNNDVRHLEKIKDEKD